jgi:uncharacterized protein YcgI (DUF1989 family)
MTLTLHAGSAEAWHINCGATIRITDPVGGQAGDVVLFDRDNPRLMFSQARTRVENRTTQPRAGAGLWSVGLEPAMLATITALSDTARLDLLYTPCCRWALRKRFNVDRDGCGELLVDALKDHQLDGMELPDPLNIFFAVNVDAVGGMTITRGGSQAGSVLELRAERDLIVAVSACPAPRADGGDPGTLLIEHLST